jgi:hypothetical protein
LLVILLFITKLLEASYAKQSGSGLLWRTKHASWRIAGERPRTMVRALQGAENVWIFRASAHIKVVRSCFKKTPSGGVGLILAINVPLRKRKAQ